MPEPSREVIEAANEAANEWAGQNGTTYSSRMIPPVTRAVVAQVGREHEALRREVYAVALAMPDGTDKENLFAALDAERAPEPEEEDYSVTNEEAFDRLVVKDDMVHTFRDSPMALIGADWPVDDIRSAIEKHGAQNSGDAATEMGHTLVVIDENGPVFIEAKPNA